MKWVWTSLLVLLACITAAFTAVARSSEPVRQWLGDADAVAATRSTEVVPAAARAVMQVPEPAVPSPEESQEQVTLDLPTADEVVRRAAEADLPDSAATEAQVDPDHTPMVLLDLEAPARAALGDGVFVPIGAGPAAFWNFNDDIGGEALDKSEAMGNAGWVKHPGTIYGNVKLGMPGPVVDALTAAAFDGQTGYVEADTIQIYNAPIHGLSFWVRSIPELAKGGVIYSESSSEDFFSVQASPDGTRLMVSIMQNNLPKLEHFCKANVFDGDWHYVWIYNANGSMVVNIDGQIDSDVTYTKKTLELTQTTIGAIRRSPARSFFGGAIDEVAIFRPDSVVQLPFTQFLGDPSKLPLLLTGPTSATAAAAAVTGPSTVLLVDDDQGNELSPFRP